MLKVIEFLQIYSIFTDKISTERFYIEICWRAKRLSDSVEFVIEIRFALYDYIETEKTVKENSWRDWIIWW